MFQGFSIALYLRCPMFVSYQKFQRKSGCSRRKKSCRSRNRLFWRIVCPGGGSFSSWSKFGWYSGPNLQRRKSWAPAWSNYAHHASNWKLRSYQRISDGERKLEYSSWASTSDSRVCLEHEGLMQAENRSFCRVGIQPLISRPGWKFVHIREYYVSFH